MGKHNWGKSAYALFLLCATTAIALPAQSFTALQSGSITPVVPNETIALPADFRDAAQLRRHGRLEPRGGAGPGHRWELVRDNGRRRGQRRWYDLQNHPKWDADDALQLLCAERLHGRRR